ncbi:MAG TPA: DUF2269 family protein [Gallionella sp.]|nr:DUF2269 family protein [Gallionella sp.]
MDHYLLFKAIHLLGVVLFLGNIIVTGWWKLMADRHGDPLVVAFAQRQVTLTDYVFTAGGVMLVIIGAMGNAMTSSSDLSFLHTYWMAWGLWLFVASGAIWAAILIPVQVIQARMARTFTRDTAIPASYWRLSRIWIFWGTVATLLPLANLYWMVFKPA